MDTLETREKLRAECAQKIHNMVLQLNEVHGMMHDIGASYSVLDYIENVQFKLHVLRNDVAMAYITLGLEDC